MPAEMPAMPAAKFDTMSDIMAGSIIAEPRPSSTDQPKMNTPSVGQRAVTVVPTE
jgi:hypothetical protein